LQKKYIVRLTAEERSELEAMVKKGKAAAYKIKHANILLVADANGPAWPDRQIAEAFSCHLDTVENVRRRLVLEGLTAAVERKKQDQPSRTPKLDGRGAADRLGTQHAAGRPGPLDPQAAGRTPGRTGGGRFHQ